MASEKPLLPREKGPAHVAAQQGDVKALREMSQEQLQELFHGATALHLAAAANQLQAMDLLVEALGLESLDSLGRTPLMHATFTRSAEAVVWLARRQAALGSADLEGFTALHLAASSGSASMCALLLNLNAPMDVRNQQGRTALGCAIEGDHLEVVEQLVLAHNADAPGATASGWVKRCLEHKVSCHELLSSQQVFYSCGPPDPWSCCSKRPEQVQVHPREACVLCGLLALLSTWWMWPGAADLLGQVLGIVSLCTIFIGTCCFFTAVWRSPGSCKPSDGCRQGYEKALQHAAAITWQSDEEPFNWWGTKGTVIHELQMVGPKRSKFCTARRQCVPMFDHYCAFLRNSIGPGNYAAFFSCVTSAFICCLSLVISAARREPNDRVILCFFAMVSSLLGAVLVFHLTLNVFGLTTWEMISIGRKRPLPYLLDEMGNYRNPYDRGFLRNLKLRLCGDLATTVEIQALSV